jgi:alcohol dehydrogenase (cytochrome c)
MNLENHIREHAMKRLRTVESRTNETPPRTAWRFNPRLGGLGFLLATILACAIAPHVIAQGLSPETLLQPPTTSWPTYNGDYSGRRFSTLDQINSKNIGFITLAWRFRANVPIKSTPLEVNGILYLTTPDNVWAVDGRTGRSIWHYQRPSEGEHIGHRGVGMYGDWLYFTTPDAQLVSLNARDGKVRWIIELADPKLGYFSTMAPLVVHDHVIAGVSGDTTDIPGFLESIDPDTGAVQWKWYTEPHPGEAGSETWPNDSDAILHGGAMTWMTGTYDPELNLLYWGTGNPNPVLAGDARPGDNLYTCTIVALNPDTGKLVWYFQPSPHDVHDWDATETPIVFDADFGGAPRKLVAQANRNGFFFVLDRATGEHLVTAPFIDINWASGVDSRGRPIPKAGSAPSPDGALVEPASDGSTNWLSPSFDPQTGLYYVSARRLFSIFYLTNTGKAEGWAGRDDGVWGNSTIRAIDYRTGKIVWNHEIGEGVSGAGILTTAGHLLFTADVDSNLLVLDPATGKTLWHLSVGESTLNSPMTYELEGRQYVLMAVQDELFAFALPESMVHPQH